MSDKIDNTRYTGDGKLANTLPKPNIVRIEVLDGNARDRYLKTQKLNGFTDNVYTLANEMRKTSASTMFSGSRASEKVFYGFLNPNKDSSFNISPEWSDQSMGSDIAGAIKRVTNAAGVLGTIANTAATIGTGINEVANKALGLNTTATGASTMKEFKSISLSDYSVSCVWYIPEQEELAKYSLKLLYRMAYPKQIAQDSAGKLVGALATNIIDKGINAVSNAVSNIGQSQQIELLNVNAPKEPTNADDNENANPVTKIVGAYTVGAAYSVTNTVNNFFGSNTTINPLPVRVCVGQHMDIEPLVITKIDTTFSKETFISEIQGRHLPLFAYTTIGFKYWVNPSPSLEFASILGQELFGADMITL